MVYHEKLVVAIKSKGKVLREFNNDVYIPFGSDYSIFLKNKDCNRKVLVNISIDGKDVLDCNSLIIDPSTDVELKGFMNSTSVNNKFRFIEKTNQISKHRGNNVEDGLVEVKYRFEEFTNYKCGYSIEPNDVVWTTMVYNPIHRDSSAIDTAVYGTFCSQANTDGITVPGATTHQGFENGSIGDLESLTYNIILRLKGKVPTKNRIKKLKSKKISKPITVKTKLRCNTCGRRWKSNIKFCGDCGTYLI